MLTCKKLGTNSMYRSENYSLGVYELVYNFFLMTRLFLNMFISRADSGTFESQDSFGSPNGWQ